MDCFGAPCGGFGAGRSSDLVQIVWGLETPLDVGGGEEKPPISSYFRSEWEPSPPFASVCSHFIFG